MLRIYHAKDDAINMYRIELPTACMGIAGVQAYFVSSEPDLTRPPDVIQGVRKEGNIRYGIETAYYHSESYGTLIIPDKEPVLFDLKPTLVKRSYDPDDPGYRAYYGQIRDQRGIFTIYEYSAIRWLTPSIQIGMSSKYNEWKFLCSVDHVNLLVHITRIGPDGTFQFQQGLRLSDFQSNDSREKPKVINHVLTLAMKECKTMRSYGKGEYYDMCQEKHTLENEELLNPHDRACCDCMEKIAERLQKVDCNLLMYFNDFRKISDLIKPFIGVLHSQSFREAANETASSYLSYHYGARLTVNDTASILSSFQPSESRKSEKVSLAAYNQAKSMGYEYSYQQFNQDVKDYFGPLYQEVGSDITRFISGLLFSSIGRHAFYPDYDVRARSSYTSDDGGTYTTSMKSYFSALSENNMNNILSQIMSAFDLSLSAENVWDMVPYSFVVDWFLTTGEQYSLLEAQDIMEKFYHKLSVISNKYHKDIITPYGTYQYEYYNRYITTQIPDFIRPVEGKFSIEGLKRHSLEGGALIVQRLR